MNYLKQIKGFYLRRRLYPLSCSAITLYYLLLEQFNLVGFPEVLSIPLGRLSSEASLGKTAICRARSELVAQGYLKLLEAPYRMRCAKYSLIALDPNQYHTPICELPLAPKGLLPAVTGGAR